MAIGDPITAIELGPEFDPTGSIQSGKIRLKIGNGLSIQPDGTIVASSSAGAPSYAQASLIGQNGNQANATLSLANGQVLKGNALIANAGNTAFVLNEPAYSVEVFGSASYEYDTGDGTQSGQQRVSPILEIFKNGNLVYPSATGYQRHASGHNDSSNQPFYIDLNPQVGDVWSCVVTQGGLQTDAMPITHGQFTVKAY